MELADVVARRRVVRRYTAEPVDAGAVERIVERARTGPTAGYSQGVHLVVVTDEQQRLRVADACDEDSYVARGFDAWVSAAPVLVVPCVRVRDYAARYAEPDKAASPPPSDWEVPFWWVDGGAALMLLLLAAVDEGLAAGFLSADGKALRAVLGIPGDVDPLGVVTIGHPAPDRPSGSLRRGRRPGLEVVHHNRW